MYGMKLIKLYGGKYMITFERESKTTSLYGKNSLQVVYMLDAFVNTDDKFKLLDREVDFSFFVTPDIRDKIDIEFRTKKTFYIIIPDEQLDSQVDGYITIRYRDKVRNIFARLEKAYQTYAYNRDMISII